MGKYRPPGWENPFGDYKDPNNIHCVHALEYEAGADAMLEVLRKNKIEIIPHWGVIYHVNHPSNGMYVFIPDDEVKLV
jgi:hypothetical protein